LISPHTIALLASACARIVVQQNDGENLGVGHASGRGVVASDSVIDGDRDSFDDDRDSGSEFVAHGQNPVKWLTAQLGSVLGVVGEAVSGAGGESAQKNVSNASYSKIANTTVATAELDQGKPNDLFSVRDFIVVGWSAVFVHDPLLTEGAYRIRELVLDFIKMLPHVHPYEPCRKAFGEIVANNSEVINHSYDEPACWWNKTNQSEAEAMVILPAAQAAWDCLPAKFQEEDFASTWNETSKTGEEGSTGTFTPDFIHQCGWHEQGMKPSLAPEKQEMLGTCRTTKWTRTCSYWTSMHLMMALAESQSVALGGKLLMTLFQIIFGGATMCRG
jgi:hypothetical protein